MFRALGPRSVAVDCGANVGVYTALMAQRGATVYAFEPNPHAFAALAERFAGSLNVHLSNAAVLDRADRAPLYLHRDSDDEPLRWSTGSSLLAAKPNVAPEHSVEVETIDLDGFLVGLGRRVQLLKLDVEGSELAILRKLLASGTIDLVDTVLVEMHDGRIPALRKEGSAVRALLTEYGARNVRLDWV